MAKKQNEVTAASMVRRARAHMALAKEERTKVKTSAWPGEAVALAGAARANEDAAKILRAEAKEIRSHR